MAASALVTMASSTLLAAAPSSLSSRSAFATPIVSVAPCKSGRKGVMVVRASASEEPRAARREMLAGLMAAGAALATGGSALAAAGPGQKGAKKTAKQADQLLKAADELTNNDSPPRYGPGRNDGSLKDPSRIAQQGGSGAVEGLQDGASKTVETAKENVQKAGDRLGDLFKPNKKGDLAASNPIDDAVGNVKGGVNDLLNNGPDKVKSDVDTASDKVRSDVATTKDKVSSDVASTGGAGKKGANIADQAQGKASNAVEQGKGFFGDLKDKITDVIPQ